MKRARELIAQEEAGNSSSGIPPVPSLPAEFSEGDDEVENSESGEADAGELMDSEEVNGIESHGAA
jgi:hypothetical protein